MMNVCLLFFSPDSCKTGLLCVLAVGLVLVTVAGGNYVCAQDNCLCIGN